MKVPHADPIPLLESMIIGRHPRADALTLPEPPKLLALQYRHVSGNHLAILLDGWRVLALDLASMRLEMAGRPVPLTPMEAKILAILMRSPGRVFTKAQLYEGAAGDYFEGDENAMMVHISKLRDKIEDDPRSPRYIRTIRGLGYRFEA